MSGGLPFAGLEAAGAASGLSGVFGIVEILVPTQFTSAAEKPAPPPKKAKAVRHTKARRKG
jgi:hypothetical protein